MAYTWAKQLVATNPKAELQDAIWLQLAKAGKPEDMSLLRQMATGVYGRRKISLAHTIFLYSLRTRQDSDFENGLAWITEMAKEESIRSYRYAIGSLVFGAYNHYKGLSENKKKEDLSQAQNRLPVAEKYKQKILSDENDSGNLWKYERL